jgi:hypothetical protein
MKNADMLMSDKEAEQRRIREALKTLLPSIVELLGELDGAYLLKKINSAISSAHKAEGDNVRMLNNLLHEVRLKIDNLVPRSPYPPPGFDPRFDEAKAAVLKGWNSRVTKPNGGNKRHTKRRHPKKGKKSRTHKGRKNFTTKKTSKVFNRKKHYQRKSAKGVKRRPYHKRR